MISDDALRQAAKLADRYITDRFLPDKAIDVIDEAGARARIAAQVPPPQVEDLKEELAGDRRPEGRSYPRSGFRTGRRTPGPGARASR